MVAADVQDSGPRGHPLGVAVRDHPPPPLESWCSMIPSIM